MSTETSGKAHYIYYLQFEKNLDDDFFKLAQAFNKWNISLIPVSFMGLSGLVSSERTHILAVLRDIRTFKTYEQNFDRFFKYGLISKKFCMHEFSSFRKVMSSYQFERMNSYFHYQLPDEIDNLVQGVAEGFYGELEQNSAWPGARRTRLSELTTLGM